MRQRYVKTVEDEERMQQALRAVEKKQLPHMLCVTNMLLHGIHDASFVRHDNTLARPYISYGASDRVDIVLTNPPFGGREEDGIESNFPKRFQTRETADLFLHQRRHHRNRSCGVILAFDLDFGDVLALGILDKPSVILFRLGDERPDAVNQRLSTVLAERIAERESGSLI